MNKLLEYGRRALFVIRVMTGYEQKMIRSQRLEFERRTAEAQAKKEALRTLPEQALLAEVRRMVEEMQALNKKFEETEAAIEEYFKPLDKEAQLIVNTKLKEDEKTMKMMVKAMEGRAIDEKLIAPNESEMVNQGTEQDSREMASANAGKVLTK